MDAKERLIEIYRLTHEQLMEEWKKRHKEKGYKIFVKDGIVCPEEWFQQPDRVLFILKEAYSKDVSTDVDWNLTEYVGNPNVSKGRIWTTAAEWQYAISHTSADGIADFNNGWLGAAQNDWDGYEAERISALRKCAIVNLKKSNGKNGSSDDDLNKYVDEDGDLLKKQIEIINPTVIICGSTFHLIRDYPKSEIRAILGSDTSGVDKSFNRGFVSVASRPVISYYHPASHYPASLAFYGLTGMYYHGIKHANGGRLIDTIEYLN